MDSRRMGVVLVCAGFCWHADVKGDWMGFIMMPLNLTRFPWLAVAGFVFAANAMLPRAEAQLGTLNEKPWLGYFAAYADKRLQITMDSKGAITLAPINDKGTPVSSKIAIDIEAGIEEVAPDGKVVLRRIKPESLTSPESPNDDFEKFTVRGKVTGDAAFELHMEQDRGTIAIGGRVTDPGTLTKLPIRFVVRVKFPDVYPYEKVANKQHDKTFLKKIEDDRLELKWTDGKRVKQDFEPMVEAASKDLNGPGIAAAQVEVASYKDRRVQFIASPGSSMGLWNAKTAPLHEGFTLSWLPPDATKDPKGEARLSIEVR